MMEISQLQKYKVAELKDKLAAAHLDTNGKKDVLIQRLFDHHASHEGAAAAAAVVVVAVKKSSNLSTTDLAPTTTAAMVEISATSNTTLTEKERRKVREARFSANSAHKNGNASSVHKAVSTAAAAADASKKDASKPGVPAKRVSIDFTAEDKLKFVEREARFAKSAKPVEISVGMTEEEKKRKRAERFGLAVADDSKESTARSSKKKQLKQQK